MSARRPWSLALALVGVCGTLMASHVGPARASPGIEYGVTDDAWLLYGPGTIDSKLSELRRLGADLVRFTIRWDEVARRKPASPRDHGDPAYDWGNADEALRGLRRHDLTAVVTLYGAPGWANGGRAENWAPTSDRSFASFAYAAARRYPWVASWTIWNEPNQPMWLRPTSVQTYVKTLLNPAYAAIHKAIADAHVGGGMTSPRAGASGISPVEWIREMGALRARLDAYAHHPYPSRPQIEGPWSPPCDRCSTLTMAELERLRSEVRRSFGPTRIWLTEYGYQTNPPDALLGVSPAVQARYYASAARRAYLAPDVDMLVFYLVRDDAASQGWQSGLVTSNGLRKPSYAAFRLPLTQTDRVGPDAVVWGQVRPRSGRQPYRVEVYERGRWNWVGGTRWTDERGFLAISVAAARGSRLRIWSALDGGYSLEIELK